MMSALNISTPMKLPANTVRCAGNMLLAVFLLLFSISSQAVTMAGTLITNQASASYFDQKSNLAATMTSNIVEVQVQQVSSFILTASQTRTVTPGGTYYLPHQIRNTGNGEDNFNLTATAIGGTLNLANVTIYADANADGLPDNLVPLANAGNLAVDAVFNFVVATTVSASGATGASGQISVTASSTLAPAAVQNNTDTLIVSPQAVLSVTKSFSLVSGPSPNTNGGAHIAVTITFVNHGNTSADNINFSDIIGAASSAPIFDSSGMAYIPGSGNWNGMVLSDTPGADPTGMSYTAATVAGVTTINGVLTSLTPGAAARITFLVDVLPGLPAGSGKTSNIVRASYSDGLSQQTLDSNVAIYNVQTGAGTPDLIIGKINTPTVFITGMPGTFNLLVSNIGTAATAGTVTVTDPLPAGLTFDAALSGGNGWACSAAGLSITGQTITCSSAAVIPVGARALLIPIVVIPDMAILFPGPAPLPPAQDEVILSNTAHVAGGGELLINTFNNDSAANTFIVRPSSSVSGRVWLDANHNRILDAGEALIHNVQVELIDATGKLYKTLSDANGFYLIGPVAPGTGYRLRFRDLASGALYATPVDGEKGTKISGAIPDVTTGELTNLSLFARVNTVEQSLPLDPSGVVYDSVSRLPVPGAIVSISGPPGFSPATHLLGGAANVAQTVGTLGFYQFLLLTGAPTGIYTLTVAAPAGYVSPSMLIPVQPGAPPFQAGPGTQPIQAQPFPPPIGSPTIYYLSVNVVTGMRDIVNNHIPLDPVVVGGTSLLISKVASRVTAEPGDFVDYTIKINNASAAALPAAMLRDNLPRGFRFVPGSARLNAVAQPDPGGAAGPTLTFAIGALAANTTATVTYRIVIGVAAALGTGINSAQANSGAVNSNVATATVKIVPGVFSDKGYVIGTVYLDCNRNHEQERDEPGIPGIRLFLEDGTNVTTDTDGKYSFYGIAPLNHVLKLDNTTMPAGAVLETLANRNAGLADSRFVDLKNGELHRADFASDTCSKAVLQEVKRRHEKDQITETERALNYKLNLQSVIQPPACCRALPASGELQYGAISTPGSMQHAAESYRPVLPDSGLNPANSNLPASPVSTVQMVDMEKLLAGLDNAFDFVDLKDSDILPIAQANVRIKGKIGSVFLLNVNGQDIGRERVGKKSMLAEKQIEAWEYIGVALNPGRNSLTARMLDQFGNERARKNITVTAPDQMARIVLDAPGTIEANGRTPLNVKIRLVDENGVAVNSRTYLTLEATQGRWQAIDIDPRERGVQVVIEGGKAEFTLMPPAQPGEETLRVMSGIIKAEHHIAYVPELRPMIAVGIIEGALNTHKLDATRLSPATANDSFEQQIRRISSIDSRNNVAERAALFLKGKVKGDYLLTLAYDSDKDNKERLFRDIQPDEYYPVYGDSSAKGYDAQSTSRLYVRVDKGKSYLLYGDYVTQSIVPARSLSQYNRSLTGVREHYENDRLMVNAFASQDTSRQTIQEIPANGTSGPYQLANNGALINSEKVEILTRDRQQPALILLVEPQSRFSDYEIEQYTGRILFKGPVPSLDANLNPKYIRVTYELDQGGKSFWISGVDGQIKLTDKLEIGGVVAHDSNPLLPTTLTGANASIRLTDKTAVVGEIAHTETITGTGNAERLEMRHDDGDFQGRIYTGRSDAAFDNAASIINKGRKESGAKGSYKIGKTAMVSGEMIESGDVLTGSKRNGMLINLEKSVSDSWRIETGVRDTRETSAVPGIGAISNTTLRVKSTKQNAGIANLSVNGEYEQDIHDSGKRVAAIGAEYQVMNRGKFYARHELISSLTSPFALNTTQRSATTVIGMDADYTPDTHLFSEYRQRGAIDGAQAEAALGLRNKWQLDEGLRLNTSVERIVNITGGAGRSAQAYTGALEYTADPLWKGSTRLEFRNADSSSGWLNSIDAARMLSDSWTVIGKEVFSSNSTKGALPGVRIQQRLQAGLAWRDMKEHDWNALSKFEHRRESDSSAANNISRMVDIFSVHANYQKEPHWQASARYAAKHVTDKSNGLSSHSSAQLVAGRIIWDATERWDLGINASVMGDRNFQSLRYGLGGETGYLIMVNLWLSAGYNIFGFREPDMIAQGTSDRGFYMRLRFKFDEETFSDIFTNQNEKGMQ